LSGGKRYNDVFRELVVTGWGGVAPKSSGVRLIESCSNCGLLTYSRVLEWTNLFDERQWDGSEIFIIWPLPRYIMVTNRVASLINSNRLTGVKCVPLSQIK